MESIFLPFLIGIFSLVSADYRVTFFIHEEEPPSFLVGDVATSSSIINNMTVTEFSSLKYSFLDQSKYQSLFTINPDNGKLFTAVVIDRETECPFQENCALSFDVAAHSSIGSKFIIISVEVVLQDKNDNSPAFQPRIVTHDISESAILETPIILSEARDLDSTVVNRILGYDMISENSPFRFSKTEKPDGGFDLKLKLKQELDREDTDAYDVVIVAKDGGDPQNSGTLTVRVIVTDFNDNSPIFTDDNYRASVPENAVIGFSVATVTADDKDIDENGQVIYRLNPRQSNLDKIKKLFTVNETTGEITVRGSLEYESGKIYDIGIEASDKGQQPRTNHTVVRVTILDVVNNSPQVKVNFLLPHNSGQVNISEASKAGAVIAHVTAEDMDSGPNGNVTCEISTGIFIIQKVPGKGYIIVVNGEVDRENATFHNISVICSDKGTPVLSTVETFLVNVIDFNDNAPQFYQTSYLGSIPENGQIGDVITQVRAWDKDLGQNANITYAIDSRDVDKFAINPFTGVVTTNTVFDRELTAKYTFIVKAIDQGSPPLTGTTTVTLTILDQNDNKPAFDVPLFQFFVSENLPSDVKVGIVSATDDDVGDNAKILYEVHDNYKSSVPFQVFPDGTVKTTQSLDREFQSKYEFHINAVDQGNIKLTSSIPVRVYVADDNDNRPVVTYPSRGNETVSVSYMAQIGTIVTQIRAYDLDEDGPNSQLKYTIVGGNSNDVFSIGENSGKIYLKRTFVVASDMKFRLQINVSDMNFVKTLYKVEHINIILKYSNATTALPLTDSGNKNVLIVVGFVAFTAILSVAIITVICIIRRNDARKEKVKEKSLEKTMYSLPPEISKHDVSDVQKGEDNSTSNFHEIQKRKKEVSFSLDDDAGDTEIRHTKDSSSFLQLMEERLQRPESAHFNYPVERRQETSRHAENSGLHHILLDSSKFCHKMAPPGDNLSDSSGEVTNSDSGRGGSDLDLSNHLNRYTDDTGKLARDYGIERNSRKYKQFENDVVKNANSQIGYGNSTPKGVRVSQDCFEFPKEGERWNPSYV